jgi:hypothetical protein
MLPFIFLRGAFFVWRIPQQSWIATAKKKPRAFTRGDGGGVAGWELRQPESAGHPGADGSPWLGV